MNRFGDAILFLVMASAWALNYPFVKFALSYEGPEGVVLFRIIFALIFAVALFGRGLKWPSGKRENILLLIYGFLNIVAFMSFWLLGESTETSSLSSIIIYTFPVLTMLFSIIFLGERASKLKIAGTFLGFGGLIVVFVDHLIIRPGIGLFLLLFAAISWASATIVFKKYFANQDSRSVNTIQFVYALPFLALFSLAPGSFTIQGLTIQFLLIALFMGSIGTAVAYGIFLYLVRKYPVSEISSFFFLVPALSIVFSLLLLHEVSTTYTYAGFALISLGIFLSSFGKSGNNQTKVVNKSTE